LPMSRKAFVKLAAAETTNSAPLAGDALARMSGAAMANTRMHIAHRAVTGLAIYGGILRTPNYSAETKPMPTS